jgi:hypothetical protein
VVDAAGEAVGRSRGSGSCFVASAACGSADAAMVVELRSFRDAVLRGTWAGRLFIGCYEAVSPPVAQAIARSALLRRMARRLIVAPATRAARAWRGRGDGQR